MTKIQELENQLDMIRAELDKLKNQEPKPGKPIKWMPEMWQIYFFRDSCGQKCSDFWRDGTTDHHRRNHLGIFPTAEDCDRWYRIEEVIREACGEAVEYMELYGIFGNGNNTGFVTFEPTVGYDSTIRYRTNNPNAADEINEKLTEDDRRWFLTGGRR